MHENRLVTRRSTEHKNTLSDIRTNQALPPIDGYPSDIQQKVCRISLRFSYAKLDE